MKKFAFVLWCLAAGCTEPSSPPAADLSPKPPGKCLQNGDCAVGQYCASSAPDVCPAAGHEGACTARPTICPNVCAPLCGCDNKTYCNACQANRAGAAVAKAGPCPDLGKACSGDGECNSGEFCKLADGKCTDKGTCQAKPTICTDIFKPVCGCDHETYSSSCVAWSKGMSVAADGACAAKPKCKVDGDCKGPLPQLCRICGDAGTACAHFVCVKGACTTQICAGGTP